MIYFIQVGESGPIKIGHTLSWSGVRRRLVELQTGNHERLRLLGSIDGFRKREEELHEEFKEHRLVGEWFEPVDEILALLTAEITDKEKEIVKNKIAVLGLRSCDLRLIVKKTGVELGTDHSTIGMYRTLQSSGILQ
jgi:hypothetical protein